MMRGNRRVLIWTGWWSVCFLSLLTALTAGFAIAQDDGKPPAAINHDLLDKAEWKQIDESVERGLTWLAGQRQKDGSFKCVPFGQPAITSFCLLAFLANGESPSDGQYSDALTLAIDFIISQQKQNGLISQTADNASPISRKTGMANQVIYNHAISALALSEAYGHCDEEQTKKLNTVIQKAIAATIEVHNWKRPRPDDKGGWKYINNDHPDDADLSSTAWQLMFLRSAKNAGFDVPAENIDKAMGFVERCFYKKEGTFIYNPSYKDTLSRGMAGAGVVALAHGGRHGTEVAQKSGDWILTRDFTKYNADKSIGGLSWQPDRYHYGVFHCTQAMYQLGGRHWEKYFPPVVETLLANQNPDGSWPPEKYDRTIGSVYSTSLCILALSVSNQMLPMFQR